MSALLRIFQTTAAREAFRYESNHVGRIVSDIEDGIRYLVCAEGLGSTAGVLFPLDPSAMGGGGTGTVWDARVVPTGLHASSDEFLTDTIANWTEWDEGGYVTSAVEFADGEQHMRFTASGNGSVRFSGRYKAVPSNEFLFSAFIADDGYSDTNAPFAGLLVGQNLGVASSDFITNDFVVRRESDANHGAVTGRTSAIYTSAGTSTSRLIDAPNSVWLLCGVRIDPGAPSVEVDCYWSTGGRYWSFFTTRTAAYAPAHFGLTFEQQSATGVASMIAKHFRVLDGTSDPRDFINGGYL